MPVPVAQYQSCQWEATGRQQVPLGLLVTVARDQAGCSGACCYGGLVKGVQRAAQRRRDKPLRGLGQESQDNPLSLHLPGY